jgi:hypothetical protein
MQRFKEGDRVVFPATVSSYPISTENPTPKRATILEYQDDAEMYVIQVDESHRMGPNDDGLRSVEEDLLVLSSLFVMG